MQPSNNINEVLIYKARNKTPYLVELG